MNISNSLELSSLKELLDNSVLTWGLIACGLAQVSKLIFELISNKRWRPSVLLETGGMPSSHSSLVTGTTAGIGLVMGFNTPIFALASTVSFVVMYDASGIRRAAGLTAARVNQLPTESWTNKSETLLKESLGHTRLEVLIGSLLGPAIALPGIVYIGSPLQVLQSLGFI